MNYKAYWENKKFYWLAKYIFDDISNYATGYNLNYNKKYIGLIKEGKACNFIRFKILDSYNCVKLYINIPRSSYIDAQLNKSALTYDYYDSLPSSYYIYFHNKEQYNQNRDLLMNLIISSINLKNKNDGIMKVTPSRKPYTSSEDLIIEYNGGKIDIADVVSMTKKEIKNKRVKELNIYLQLETGMIYYTADGVEGSTNIYHYNDLHTQVFNNLEFSSEEKKRVIYVDVEYNRVVKALNLPKDIDIVKIEGTKRIRLMYNEKRFAYIDYNKMNYHIFTNECILDTLGIEYILDKNHGISRAGVKNIPFDNTSILLEIIELIKTGFIFDEKIRSKEDIAESLNKEQLYIIAKARSSRNPQKRKRVVNASDRDMVLCQDLVQIKMGDFSS